MSNINFSNIKGDLFGGVTAGIIGLPVAIAFGVTSGLGPIAGLYGAISIGIIAAFFGGTRAMISAPTGPMTVVAALIVSTEVARVGSLEAAFPVIVATFVCAGIFQIILGVLRVGKYIHYIPYPVVAGFMCGIGCILIILSLSDFFGVPKSKDVIDGVIHLPDAIMNANFQSVALALITVIIIFAFPYITKAIPSTLVALVSVTLFAVIFNLDVKYVGEIPIGLPELKFTTLFALDPIMIPKVLFNGISLGALGMIDTLLTSIVSDKLTRTRHNSNKELFGQGIANAFSGLIGGTVGAGTTVSTVVNIKSGATTSLSGVIQGFFLLVIVVVGGSIASKIPNAVLAGILVTVGIKVFDYRAIRDFKVIPRTDLFIIILVCGITVFWDLMIAVAIGLVFAMVFFMKRMADVIEIYSKGSSLDKVSDRLIDTFANAEQFRKDVYVKSLKGPIFFGFASRMEEQSNQHKDIKALIINMHSVPYMDQSGVYSLADSIHTLHSRNIKVCISSANAECIKLMRGTKMIPHLVQEDHVFDSLEEAVMWLAEPGRLDDTEMDPRSIYAPSAFTPDGDGANDAWMIKNIHLYPNCTVRITDRSGKEIFRSNGYATPWDGTIGGVPAVSDMYHYEIDLGDGSSLIKGNVTLIL